MIRFASWAHASVVLRSGSLAAALICPQACAPDFLVVTASNWVPRAQPLAEGAGVAAHPAARSAGELASKECS